MGLEEKAKAASGLKNKYLHLYEHGTFKEAKNVELQYLQARAEVLSDVDENINRQRSVPIKVIKERVRLKPKVKRIETGIRELDYELVTEEMKTRGTKGGLSLGNFVQIAGSKGVGKSTFMLKMLTGFSNYEKVCWFDFEMGEDRVVQKLEEFTHSDDNMLYYASSRALEDVIDEIKFLNATGVNHFVVDSAMKIRVGNTDRYDKFSTISGELSALTSSLGINIYMINQMSQTAERDGYLSIKHGNDAEYDADFMLFILNLPLIENDKNVYDELGMMKMDEDNRIVKCTKNRQDERLFTVIVPKSSIVGIKPIEVTYES